MSHTDTLSSAITRNGARYQRDQRKSVLSTTLATVAAGVVARLTGRPTITGRRPFGWTAAAGLSCQWIFVRLKRLAGDPLSPYRAVLHT